MTKSMVIGRIRAIASECLLYAASLVVGFLILFSPSSLSAQDKDNYDRGTSAGGKWTEYRAEDRMTAQKRVRFELPSEDARDSDEDARIILYCTDGKLNLADFRPGTRLARPNWPGFWGQPQMRVRVRADNSHSDHSWNWVNGHFLAMDKGTTRELIGAHIFRIEFQSPEGTKIAEFSPVGVDLGAMDKACGLKPKRP